MPEIEVAQPGALDAFWERADRTWRSELWEFRVVWHEQVHDLAIVEAGATVAALRLRVAASLAHVVALYVVPERRLQGLGRALEARAEELAKYFNCHKMTVEVFAGRAAERFFERCGYKTEAVLPQHTFKLDVAVLRKFLL
jgi:GNAT superfamily N-acetyltransferase